MKLGRNDPCHCGSGKKYKKCHSDSDTQTLAQAPAEDLPEVNRRMLDTQLAKFAPTVTLSDVEAKIKAALAQGSAQPMVVIEEIFNDDNLNLNNKRQADRLFRAFMAVWADIEKQQKKG
jgi:hypothetical protein